MTRSESKAATRAELLDAARSVFVRRGYHGASLDLVAGEAGYTKGAVYSAFGSKGAMFLAVYEREVDRRWTKLEREARPEDAGSAGAFSAHDYAARFRAERGWMLALLEFRLHAARDAELNAAYAEAHRRVLDRFGALIARVTGAPPDRAADAALALMALANGHVLEALALPDEASEARYAAAAAALAADLLDQESPP